MLNREMTTLLLFFTDVYSGGVYTPFSELSNQYPHARPEDRDYIDPNLLGTCHLFQAADKPTIACLYISFVPGRPFEKNAIAQRLASDLNHDIDLRAYITNDTQAARDINVRKALEDLREQLDIRNIVDVIVFALHNRCFNEGGSYFEILRKFFVIELGRSYALHLTIDKKYQDFIDISRTTRKIKKIDREVNHSEPSYDIPTYAEIVRSKRMRM